MKIVVEREIPGRTRMRLSGPVPEADVAPLLDLLDECPEIESARLYPRIGVIAVTHAAVPEARVQVIRFLTRIERDDIERKRDSGSFALATQSRNLLLEIAWLAGTYLARRAFMPQPLSMVYNVASFVPFLRAALRSILGARIDVPVLDASAIGVSLAQFDAKTAGETMFLLQLGETLEKYTESCSKGALVASLMKMDDTVFLVQGSTEREVGVADLRKGDLVAVRTGMSIPIDGAIESGAALVNQASLTGEPLAIERAVGDDVFAGTLVEEGEIIVRVKGDPGKTRLRSIVALVENAGQYQSPRQANRERLAARIVPWNFVLAGATALVTRSVERVAASLMVDYSCGLKLTGSISVLSAMQQSAKSGFTVKGSSYFDAVCDADAIVFDKTGTLTEAAPHVAKILGTKGWSQREVLRFAACLEEHFPHPVARAVVNEAFARGLEHRELHGDVEYLVAHGIASTLQGKRVVIGSKHFVVEDEGIVLSKRQKERINRELSGLSALYLAVDGRLAGVIGIEDPLKEGASEAIGKLRALGFKRIVMLTGDNPQAAARVAEAVGLDEFRANQLPEDKHAFVEQLKTEGFNVMMVGDGVNDAPAIALADVGVAMGQGTAIAKDVADITLSGGDLSSIASLVKLSRSLSARMEKTFWQVLGFNTAFLAAGIAGAITPQASSLLHNVSTIALSLQSGRRYEL